MNVEVTKATQHRIIHDNVGAEEGQIEGAIIKHLRSWPDDRGHFTEIFRHDEPVAENFETLQTSLTMTRPDTIKAFHYHMTQDDIFCPLIGEIRIALVDFRVDSPTFGYANSIFCGEHHLKAVRIPRGIAHGYEVLGNNPMTMVYYTDQVYTPSDEHRQNFDDPAIAFTWWGVENR